MVHYIVLLIIVFVLSLLLLHFFDGLKISSLITILMPGIYILYNNNILTINKIYKDFMVGQTIYNNLKK